MIPTDVRPEVLFEPLGPTYERASKLLSLGLEAGWRRRLVERAAARETDRYLDVATGTGLVARALRRGGCRVVGVDLTPAMVGAADRSDGIAFVLGRAERLPFADASFDGLTVTYLLRYVDDPVATMREIARVVRPGGHIAMLEFDRPGVLPLRIGWWLYTRVGLPLVGTLVSGQWRDVGAFLGRSIDRFCERYDMESVWRAAGIADVRTQTLSLGAAAVTWGNAPAATVRPVAAPPSEARPAFYALSSGGWRDYVTLLHAPYALWHLSYVVLGAALATELRLDRLAWSVLAFFLALGVGVHALDEMNGRPLRTRIPHCVLWALAAVGLGGAVALGLAATTILGPGMLAFIAVGIALALSYPLEIARGRLHSDVWFAIGWGAFPVLTGAYASGGSLTPAAVVGAAYALAMSYAQRTLSTWVRTLRRRTAAVSGEMRMTSGDRVMLDRDRLIAAPEGALRWLVAVSILVASVAVALRLSA
ncbi:MAG: class I SAM-dependent methyltransferase [Chloroflexota bacterium]|nr:class I SAM-dependent methyltransferase [Chloroflexota bacterium]